MLNKLNASLLLIIAEFLTAVFEMMSGNWGLDKHQNNTVEHLRGAGTERNFCAYEFLMRKHLSIFFFPAVFLSALSSCY